MGTMSPGPALTKNFQQTDTFKSGSPGFQGISPSQNKMGRGDSGDNNSIKSGSSGMDSLKKPPAMPKSKFKAINSEIQEQPEESEDESDQSLPQHTENPKSDPTEVNLADRTLNSDDLEVENYLRGEANIKKEEFIRDPRFDWKYLAGAGQLSENLIGMSTEILEQGEYLIHVEFENTAELIKSINLVKFHFFFNVGTGTVACEKS
jgi:hypothetical protein